jgi:uncharacterized RDD family membrane protein YckC
MNSNEFEKEEQAKKHSIENGYEKDMSSSHESTIVSEPRKPSETSLENNQNISNPRVENVNLDRHRGSLSDEHNESIERPEISETYHSQKETEAVSPFEGFYAGFWMRFWAYLLDLIVIGSVNRMILNPVFRALDVPLAESGIFSPMSISTAIVFYLYFVLMTKFYGQTLGKMVFGLKVVELDGKRLSWGTVIFREWIGRFISATVMILYIVVAFTKKKQGLHDLFADTTVIYEPR